MDEYNEYYSAWKDGFNAGIEASRKETFRDKYEALVKEIREDERNKIMKVIKEYFNGGLVDSK